MDVATYRWVTRLFVFVLMFLPFCFFRFCLLATRCDSSFPIPSTTPLREALCEGEMEFDLYSEWAAGEYWRAFLSYFFELTFKPPRVVPVGIYEARTVEFGGGSLVSVA